MLVDVSSPVLLDEIVHPVADADRGDAAEDGAACHGHDRAAADHARDAGRDREPRAGGRGDGDDAVDDGVPPGFVVLPVLDDLDNGSGGCPDERDRLDCLEAAPTLVRSSAGAERTIYLGAESPFLRRETVAARVRCVAARPLNREGPRAVRMYGDISFVAGAWEALAVVVELPGPVPDFLGCAGISLMSINQNDVREFSAHVRKVDHEHLHAGAEKMNAHAEMVGSGVRCFTLAVGWLDFDS